LFLLLDSEQEPAQDFSVIRHVAEYLDAPRYKSQIGDIENRLRDLVRRILGPEKDYTAALLALPPAVNQSDAEMLQKRPFAAYEQLLSGLKAAPTAPDVLAYVDHRQFCQDSGPLCRYAHARWASKSSGLNNRGCGRSEQGATFGIGRANQE
jgi:hypothetical protein